MCNGQAGAGGTFLHVLTRSSSYKVQCSSTLLDTLCRRGTFVCTYRRYGGTVTACYTPDTRSESWESGGFFECSGIVRIFLEIKLKSFQTL